MMPPSMLSFHACITDNYDYLVSVQQCSTPFQLYVTKDTKYKNTTMMWKPEQSKTIDAPLFNLEITYRKRNMKKSNTLNKSTLLKY